MSGIDWSALWNRKLAYPISWKRFAYIGFVSWLVGVSFREWMSRIVPESRGAYYIGSLATMLFLFWLSQQRRAQ